MTVHTQVPTEPSVAAAGALAVEKNAAMSDHRPVAQPARKVSAASVGAKKPKAKVAGAGQRTANRAGGWPAERRRARRTAVQVLYEVDCTGHRPGIALNFRQEEERFGPETLTFLYWLVSGVLSYKPELDQLIGRYAPEWPVQQLAIVDRNVLRLSIFELSSPDGDAPPKVVIDEAVELAKTFGSDSSPRFVNGVLATALREISQPPEHGQVSR